MLFGSEALKPMADLANAAVSRLHGSGLSPGMMSHIS